MLKKCIKNIKFIIKPALNFTETTNAVRLRKNVKGYIEGLNMLANMRLCANVLSQHVIQTSLGGYQSVDELLIPGGRIYEQREFITNTVNAIPGLSAVKPDAVCFLPSITKRS